MNAPEAVEYLSGYCGGALPPTPKPVGGPVPDRRLDGGQKPKACLRCRRVLESPRDFSETGKQCDERARCLRCMRELRERQAEDR